MRRWQQRSAQKNHEKLWLRIPVCQKVAICLLSYGSLCVCVSLTLLWAPPDPHGSLLLRMAALKPRRWKSDPPVAPGGDKNGWYCLPPAEGNPEFVWWPNQAPRSFKCREHSGALTSHRANVSLHQGWLPGRIACGVVYRPALRRAHT